MQFLEENINSNTTECIIIEYDDIKCENDSLTYKWILVHYMDNESIIHLKQFVMFKGCCPLVKVAWRKYLRLPQLDTISNIRWLKHQ